MQNTAFTIFVVCASILSLNLVMLASLTGYYRTKLGQYLNPEDLKLNPKALVTLEEEGIVGRYRRAHRNALENIPPFLIMGFLLLGTGPATWLAALLFGTFTVMRVVHSVVYIKGLQPIRTISFGISSAAFAGVIVTLLVKVLTA